MDDYVGRGTITSASAERAEEGTTFEASCYADPLALEHLTGSFSSIISHVGTHDWPAPVGLRFTTKYDNVEPMLALPHHGRTRTSLGERRGHRRAIRGRHGTAAPARRHPAALAGYRVRLTIAPIMPIPDWRDGYGDRLRSVPTRSPTCRTSTSPSSASRTASPPSPRTS